MYESRLHATNNLISIALDARSGELLELVKENSQDNFIKSNCNPKAWMPFVIEVNVDGEKKIGHPARYLDFVDHPEYMAKIEIDQKENSAFVKVHYPVVAFEDLILPIKVTATIELPENDVRTKWNLHVEQDGVHEIERIQYPAISGMWIGDTWENNSLMFPQLSGFKIDNPVKILSMPPRYIYWKWQEYQRKFSLDAVGSVKDARDCYVLENGYSGPASMMYMDMYDENLTGAIYMTCRNNDFRIAAVRAETFGENQPGMGLAIVHNVFDGEKDYDTQECIVALHDGDWHWAADEYRAYRMTLEKFERKKLQPDWVMKSPGLMAHYDFKYQTQGVVHKYNDIPALYEQAKEVGLNHLLLSGWNFDGFDHGFPEYRVDPELGTEQEFIDAVHKVRNEGGHVAFYVNSRLCNTKYPHRQKYIEDCTIVKKDGTPKIENYGARNIDFACLCNQTPAWREELVRTVDYLVNTIGADSMYFDQMAMGSVLCFNKEHKEHGKEPYWWNLGYNRILEGIEKVVDDETGLAMLYEGCSDVFGWGSSGQLISTLFRPYSHPEMFRYTFPDHILMDMMNPRRHSGMRAEHVARKSTMHLYRAFVTGCYFWVYDLEFDNTFRRDPEQYERLKHTLKLRSAWLENYGFGKFLDTVGVKDATKGLIVKKFEIDDGILYACANEKLVENAKFEAYVDKKDVKAFIRTYNNPDEEKEFPVTVEEENGKYVLKADYPNGEELAVIVVR